ncbi:MAG: hypothetical protein KA010_00810 [Saprospiraceae bacterium]|nr:hypothetical protein [Saprospiraceae bacterium]
MKNKASFYRDFLRIFPNAHRAFVNFFEENIQDINELPPDELFDIYLTYTDSLYNLEMYDKYIKYSEQILITSINSNSVQYQSEQLYENTLFRMAKAHYSLYQYHKCDHLLKELIRLDPTNDEAIELYRKSIIQQVPQYTYQIRAYSLYLFLLTAVIILIEICIIRQFYSEFTRAVELTRTITLFIGIVILILESLYRRWKIYIYIENFVSASFDKKIGKLTHQ